MGPLRQLMQAYLLEAPGAPGPWVSTRPAETPSGAWSSLQSSLRMEGLLKGIPGSGVPIRIRFNVLEQPDLSRLPTDFVSPWMPAPSSVRVYESVIDEMKCPICRSGMPATRIK